MCVFVFSVDYMRVTCGGISDKSEISKCDIRLSRVHICSTVYCYVIFMCMFVIFNVIGQLRSCL